LTGNTGTSLGVEELTWWAWLWNKLTDRSIKNITSWAFNNAGNIGSVLVSAWALSIALVVQEVSVRITSSFTVSVDSDGSEWAGINTDSVVFELVTSASASCDTDVALKVESWSAAEAVSWWEAWETVWTAGFADSVGGVGIWSSVTLTDAWALLVEVWEAATGDDTEFDTTTESVVSEAWEAFWNTDWILEWVSSWADSLADAFFRWEVLTELAVSVDFTLSSDGVQLESTWAGGTGINITWAFCAWWWALGADSIDAGESTWAWWDTLSVLEDSDWAFADSVDVWWSSWALTGTSSTDQTELVQTSGTDFVIGTGGAWIDAWVADTVDWLISWFNTSGTWSGRSAGLASVGAFSATVVSVSVVVGITWGDTFSWGQEVAWLTCGTFVDGSWAGAASFWAGFAVSVDVDGSGGAWCDTGSVAGNSWGTGSTSVSSTIARGTFVAALNTVSASDLSEVSTWAEIWTLSVDQWNWTFSETFSFEQVLSIWAGNTSVGRTETGGTFEWTVFADLVFAEGSDWAWFNTAEFEEVSWETSQTFAWVLSTVSAWSVAW
jgi:hypothetical protein